MIGDKLFRPYSNGKPVTTKWYRTKEEALDWASILNRGNIDIREIDINDAVKNRKKTGFRGLF